MARAFSLAGLLRLRTMQQDQAGAELAEKNAARARAEARRIESARWLTSSGVPDRSDELTFHAAIAARAAAVTLLQDARVSVAVAQEAVADASATYQAARARTKALEKLEERHDAAELVADLAAEQIALDEVAARRRR